MGGWGTGSFENDDALDWLYNFSEDQSLTRVEKALEKIEGAAYKDYDWWDIFFAVAACEVIAAIKGRLSPDFPIQYINDKEAPNWEVPVNRIDFSALEPYLKPEITLRAERLLSQLKSEPKIHEGGMWIESTDYYQWINDLEELKNRISA